MCCGRATRIKNCSLYRHVPILATAVPVKYYRIKLPVRFKKNFWQFKIREPTYSVNITKQTHVQIIVYGILEIGTKNSIQKIQYKSKNSTKQYTCANNSLWNSGNRDKKFINFTKFFKNMVLKIYPQSSKFRSEKSGFWIF